MADFVRNEILFNRRFFHRSCRRTTNGVTTVLGCRYFAALTTQLANDCGLLDGKKLLAECAEDTFYPVLINAFTAQNAVGAAEKFALGEQYFAAVGLGKLEVKHAGFVSGRVELLHSHIDEGWVAKWGVSDKPINHIGRGFVTALFSAVFDRAKGAYAAVEEQSIACGAKISVISVSDVKKS